MREVFCLLVYPSNAINNQGWAELMPGAQNCIQFSLVSDSDPVFEPTPTAS